MPGRGFVPTLAAMIARALVATLAASSWTSGPPRGRAGRRGLALRAAPVVALLVAVALPSGARAGLPADVQAIGYAPGELIVKFEPGVPAAQQADALHDRDARLKRSLPVARSALIRLPGGAAMGPAIRAFERDPRVVWAEPNAYRHGGALAGDPLFDEQWGLERIGAPEAWERTTGSPEIKVAVIDSGINLGQPDLEPNIWRNPGESGAGREANGVDDDGNGFVDDWRGWDFVQRDNDPSDNYGHGTHVAGTIAASGDNDLGVAGVAWRASLIPVRVLDNLNSGYCADIAEGMAYAVRAGARVVNISLGSRLPCQAELDVIAGAPGTLFVIAAMNEGLDVDASPFYPCAYRSSNVVCVAASDSGDTLAGFSNYGARSVDLAAPGVSVLSSYLKWGPQEDLFVEDFESPLTGRWITGGSPDTWDRTPFVGSRSGGWALSNSVLGYYENDTDNWAQLTQGLDLTGRRDCAASVWIEAALGPFDPVRPLEADRLVAETSSDAVDWSRRPTVVIGSGSRFERWLIDLSQLEGHATGGLRFRLLTNGADTYGGVALDDLKVLCVPPLESYSGASDEFAFDSGTSMAAPHVAGVAALVLSLDPRLSAAEVKQRILRSVDPLAALAGRTVTGGRLNAARALEPPPPAAPPGAAPAPAAGAGPPSQAWALEVNLKALARTLARRGLRGVLRAGGLRAERLHALSPGRFALEVKARGDRIAWGSCSTPQPAVCRLTARLNRRGRVMLRRSRRVRLTLALSFDPLSGRTLARRMALTLGKGTSS
jgi:thermitase